MASAKVDPTSWVPRYRQVAQILTTEIEDGTYLPGEKLPTEKELAEALETSVDSIRGGLRVLRVRGLVETSQGVGTRVMSSPEVAEHHIPPGAAVRARMPTPAERRRWKIPEGVPVLEVTGEDGGVIVLPADRTVLRNAGGAG